MSLINWFLEFCLTVIAVILVLSVVGFVIWCLVYLVNNIVS